MFQVRLQGQNGLIRVGLLKLRGLVRGLGVAPGVDQQEFRATGRQFGGAEFAHQVQGQVKISGDTAGGDQVVLIDQHLAGLQVHLGMAFLELIGQVPVGRGVAAVEQAGTGQQKRTGAHRTQAGSPGVLPA
jgi:hypothetical protein